MDYWLRLRDGTGYGSGVTNTNNELFQAGPCAMSAWANAANAAMLADAFRIAGNSTLSAQYTASGVEAYGVAGTYADPMLDQTIVAAGRGRDLKMMAAAFLYNLTGDQKYEAVIQTESLCTTASSPILNGTTSQIWGTAAYLMTPQPVHFQTLWNNMKASVIAQAKAKEVGNISTRPLTAGHGRFYGINHGSGGTEGAGGNGGTSGASGRGGVSGGGGSTGGGGTVGVGGVSAAAGSASGGGVSSAGGSTGGSTAGSGEVSATAGSVGGGGVLATGGEAGSSTAGVGGVSAAGGTDGGGMGGSSGSTKVQASGCTFATHPGRPVGLVSWLAVPALLLWRRRTRHKGQNISVRPR